MFQSLVDTAGRWFEIFQRPLLQPRPFAPEVAEPFPRPPRRYERLQRVILTDEVSRTLFDEYAAHREGSRGEEETGWLLLGLREVNEALVLATLPAGFRSRASQTHIWITTSAHAVASCIVRQQDRRLRILGVVHTHPGSLRHPSNGDYRGDSQWVGQLRGCEGIFGIGTADGACSPGLPVARQPQPHLQCLGELSFSWYTLKEGDHQYRPIEIALTLGPDLARPLHCLWMTVEHFAEQLDCIYRQQAGVQFSVVEGDYGPALAVRLPLAKKDTALCLVLERKEARYYLARAGDLAAIDTPDERVDRSVYLLLAELAGLE